MSSNVDTFAETVDTAPDIRVVRFELYPAEEPICYCVGFSIAYNGQRLYRDTQVSLDQAASCECETEIAQKAYETLKPSIDAWIENAKTRSPILGSTFVPE